MARSIPSIIVPRLVATILSAGLAYWAVTGIIALSASTTVRSLAAAIESGSQPRLDVLDRLDREQVYDRILTSCDTSELRALVTVRLKELDLAFATADPIRADRAYEGAETAIRKSLSCAPLDGNLWLRLAMLETARRGASPRAKDFLSISRWAAPSEGWIVRARVYFTSRSFAAGMTEVESELRADLRTLVNRDAPTRVAEMFMTAPAQVQPLYQEWIDLLPDPRREMLNQTLERYRDRSGET